MKTGRAEKAVTGSPSILAFLQGFESGGGREKLHARGGENSRLLCPQSAFMDWLIHSFIDTKTEFEFWPPTTRSPIS